MIKFTASEREALAEARRIKRKARTPAPASREAQDATLRLSMSKARRDRILAAHGHACAYPGCDLAQGLELDHTIPIELGGKDDDSNLRPLCGYHHRAKTKLDAKMIAKARRLRKSSAAPSEPSRIASRGFSNTHRPMRSGR